MWVLTSGHILQQFLKMVRICQMQLTVVFLDIIYNCHEMQIIVLCCIQNFILGPLSFLMILLLATSKIASTTNIDFENFNLDFILKYLQAWKYISILSLSNYITYPLFLHSFLGKLCVSPKVLVSKDTIMPLGVLELCHLLWDITTVVMCLTHESRHDIDTHMRYG